MNKTEFIEWLKSDNDTAEGFMHGCGSFYKEKEKVPQLQEVSFELVENYGGEDCGSTYYSVYKFKLPDGEEFFIRFNGWYASHYGADYNGLKEVQPKQKTITEYT